VSFPDISLYVLLPSIIIIIIIIIIAAAATFNPIIKLHGAFEDFKFNYFNKNIGESG
jgi:hypothetical protein